VCQVPESHCCISPFSGAFGMNHGSLERELDGGQDARIVAMGFEHVSMVKNGRRFQLDGATRPEKSTFLAVVEWALSKRVALREHLSEEGGQAASTLIVGQ